MSRFEDMLHDAADGPVRFDHREIARRVRHRRRNRLAGLAAVVVLGVVGFVAGFADGEQVVDSVGPVQDGAVTVDELVADRWVVFAYSAVTVGASRPPFLEFGDDGRLGGVDVCRPISGTWELDGARLVTSLEQVEEVPCADGTAGLYELLQDDPTIGRFGEDEDTLRLSSGDDFFGLQRFDRLGDIPTPTLLEGEWLAGGGAAGGADSPGSVTFAPDGSGVLAIMDCSRSFEWSLEDDRVAVEGLDRNGVPCDDGVVGGGLLLALTSTPRLRVDGSTLWMSSDLGVDLLRSAGADAGSSSTTTSLPDEDVAAKIALEQAVQSARFVAASPSGVTLHAGGGATTRIADGDAAVAFAVGPDLVVHQPASTAFAEYPPTPEGDPVVWISGEERVLPVDPDARSVRLLDASTLDAATVALIAESHGGVGPDDTFEELVLVDLETFERTTVVRRPAWESAHVEARVLPDGDVIGLFASESLMLLARWAPDEDGAVWTVEVGSDSRPTFTMHGDRIRVVDSGFDGDFEPVLSIRRYGTDGTEQDEQTVTVADPAGELGAGLFCTSWLDDVHLLCGRSDGPPVVISLAARSYEQVVATTGSYPTAVRPE